MGSFGDSWEDFLGDSCGFSACVLAVSSGVLVVVDVSVSPPSVGVLGEVLPSDSGCEIVKPPYGKSRRYEFGEFARRRGGHKKRTVELTKVGQRPTNRLQEGC